MCCPALPSNTASCYDTYWRVYFSVGVPQLGVVFPVYCTAHPSRLQHHTSRVHPPCITLTGPYLDVPCLLLLASHLLYLMAL